MYKIGFDAKRYYHNRTGLGNYSRTLVAALKEQYPDIGHKLYDSKSIERTFSLGRQAVKDGCQLFHGLSNELPRDIVKSGIPSIVTMHDVAWRTFPDMYTFFDRHIYDWKYGWSAKNATHVVCISESTKRDVMRFYHVPAERISVIYQPVQQCFYTAIADDEATRIALNALPYLNDNGKVRPFIITVGSINSRKNLLGMVKAFNRVPEEERPCLIRTSTRPPRSASRRSKSGALTGTAKRASSRRTISTAMQSAGSTGSPSKRRRRSRSRASFAGTSILQ